MAIEKLKVPGEPSTTNPSFASPNIQTAPDVATSQKVAGNAAAPTDTSTVIPPTQPGAQNPTSTAAPAAPKPSATVSSVGPPTAPQASTVPTTSGAPPGVPNTSAAPPPTPPTVGLAPTPKSILGKNAAEDEWIQAQNENAMKLYEAALGYNGGPTGALEGAQRQAEQGLKASTANRGAAGTIESSLYGDDKSLISKNLGLADTKAYNTYQEAVNTANAALNKAQIAYARAGEQEKREIAEAAEKREQTEAIEKSASVPKVAASPSVAAPTPAAYTTPQGFVHPTGDPGVGYRTGGPVPDKYGWVHTKNGSYRVK